MSKFKIVCLCWLLSIASVCSTRKSIVTAYTARFLPVWNPLMEVMITTCTLPTVLTQFIHSFFKPGPNFIIKNKVKIMDNNQNNNYNTQLSDMHLAPSLCSVERHNIYRVSQEECARLREDVPYAKVYRYNPKHLCPKLNGYGDNGQ